MRTWMLLWLAAVGLVIAAPVLAESDDLGDGLGLDFYDPATGGEVEKDPAEAGEPEPGRTGDPVADAEPAMVPGTGHGQTPESASVDGEGLDAGVSPAEEVVGAEVDDMVEEAAEVYAEQGQVDAAAAETGAPAEDVPFDATPTDAAPASDMALGPMGVDAEGRVGRVHTVAPGDTLWDISNAYLGTPWVWPSVWNDNDGISNPHRIAPGDHIWITAGEMRIVTDAQKDQLISAVPDEVEWDEEESPAALGEEDDLMAASEPTEMDELPVAVPAEAPDASPTGAMVRVSEAESLGYVSPDTIDAAASIVDSAVPRTWLVDGDAIYIGLGEGEVQRGDEFTIYRDADEVRDLDGTLLGYHVEVLGWARVKSVEAESSTAEIRMSQSEIRRGDRVIPRDPVNISVPLKRSPDAVPGNIVYMPDSRTKMGDGEWVYVNRGNLHGVEPGTELEVYDPGRFLKDEVKRQKVLTPDHVVAQLIVVDTQPDSAVAYIVHSRRALSVGDKVRPTAKKLAQR